MPDDLHLCELAWCQIAPHIDTPVDVGSIGLSARDKVRTPQFAYILICSAEQTVLPGINHRSPGFFSVGFSLDQHAQGSSHVRFGHCDGDAMLSGQSRIESLALDLVSDLPGHAACARAFLLRIS